MANIEGLINQMNDSSNNEQPNIPDQPISDQNIPDPNTSNPNTSDQNTADLNTSDPNTADLNTADLNTSDPNTADLNTSNPNTSDPNISNSNVDYIDGSERNIDLSAITQPAITQPGITQPAITQPGITQPGITQSESQPIQPTRMATAHDKILLSSSKFFELSSCNEICIENTCDTIKKKKSINEIYNYCSKCPTIALCNITKMQNLENKCTDICKSSCQELDLDEMIKNCNNCHISHPEYKCNINDQFYNKELNTSVNKYNHRFDTYKNELLTKL